MRSRPPPAPALLAGFVASRVSTNCPEKLRVAGSTDQDVVSVVASNATL